jgi:cysteine desulfurase
MRIPVLTHNNNTIIVSHSGILCTIVAYYTDFTVFFKPFNKILKKKRIYLDYAASTPVDTKMLNSFPKIPTKFLGANPNALHFEGVMLSKALLNARSVAAKSVGAQNDEIVFTSNATESDNLAILGSVQYFLSQGFLPGEIITYVSPFEHSAVSESIKSLSPEIPVCFLKQEQGYVNIKNIVFPKDIKVAIFSIMMVQNEIGTLQDIKEIAKQVRKLRKEYTNVQIIFHTDATQAPLFYDLNVLRLGVDMMTLGATKLYTQKGVGMLYKKRGIKILPINYGGGQEHGLRPGTEPVELIHNFAYALSYAQNNYEKEFLRIKFLQEYFENKILQVLPVIKITAIENDRTPHITHLVVHDIDSELLVIELDARGIAVSSKSACKNEDSSESELLALLYPGQNLGAIRVSYGRKTTKRELDKTIEVIGEVLDKYKKSLFKNKDLAIKF